MMNYKGLLFATLLSSTAALPRLNEGEKETFLKTQLITLGAAFLATADKSKEESTSQRDAYFGAELETEAIGPLAMELGSLCREQGFIESESNNRGGEGQVTSYSLTCRFPEPQFETVLDGVRNLISESDITSYSVSSYANGNSPSSFMAQKEGLEMLLKMAETIEQVMLIVPAWQSVISQGGYSNPRTNSVTISLNENQFAFANSVAMGGAPVVSIRMEAEENLENEGF